VPTEVKPDQVKLAQQVISTFEGPLNLADYKDEYREGLQRIIDAKIAGQEVVTQESVASPKVVNLMEALKQSLNAVSERKKRPAKSQLAMTAPKRKRA
jgi:DNA end-binding protein Ku